MALSANLAPDWLDEYEQANLSQHDYVVKYFLAQQPGTSVKLPWDAVALSQSGAAVPETRSVLAKAADAGMRSALGDQQPKAQVMRGS